MSNSSSANELASKAASSQSVIMVSADDLPLCCPPQDEKLWNMHPRVYLDIKPGTPIQCPYCGASYQLIAD